MSELNPLTLGDTPDDYVENPDGSVDVPEADLEPKSPEDSGFYDNLADQIDSKVLNDISTNLIDLIEKDQQARKKRDEQYEEGIRRTGLGNDAPGGATFAGASKVVHPVMAEACIDFASSAIKELFPPSGPVKTEHVGIVSREQSERGERKKELMNWQLTTQMPEYYDELEQLLSQMPLGGAQYLKLRFDEALRRPIAEFVPIDEILVPYAASSFYMAQRMTHRQLITEKTFEDRIDSDFYRDIESLTDVGSMAPDQTASAAASDKVEGKSETAYNEDGLRAILEVYTWLEIDDDPLADSRKTPYIIHMDEFSKKVLAVYRNWDDQDETYEKLDWVVEWKFIPWRGAHGIGLPHLIGGLSAALTGALRALLDSAHINNAPSMLKLKGARGSVGTNKQVNITEVTEVEAPPNTDDIRKIAMPMPFNQPSPVLFQLLGFLTDAAKGVVSTAEEKISEAGNQMPVGTAMALIEQGSKVFSAIHGRLHRSQAKTLEILHRINSKWLDEESQQQKLGKVLATREDFTGSMDVIPASDPNIFSETQRYAQIQAVLQMSQDPSVQWNKTNIYKRMLQLMHVAQPDELLPVQLDPVTADPITEDDAGLKGTRLKADINQDHLAHIEAHLSTLSAPWIITNPMIPPQIIQGILGHINEHILMLQSETVAKMAHGMLLQAQAEGTPATPEQMTGAAIRQAQQVLGPKLQPVMQQIGMLQQELQKRTPPPQMPPEVQASLQIAQMDIQRKTQYDQATLQAKQAEMQANQQRDVAEQAMKQAQAQFEQQQTVSQQRFEQFMAAQQQAADARAIEMANQVELIRNEQDNKQHQMTELLKNHEDNQTQMFIEQMKQQLATLPAMQAAPSAETGPDLNPQLQQMQMYLDQLGKQQTNDALATVVQGLQATIEHLGRPKMIVRDAQGKAQGIQ